MHLNYAGFVSIFHKFDMQLVAQRRFHMNSPKKEEVVVRISPDSSNTLNKVIDKTNLVTKQIQLTKR